MNRVGELCPTWHSPDRLPKRSSKMNRVGKRLMSEENLIYVPREAVK